MKRTEIKETERNLPYFFLHPSWMQFSFLPWSASQKPLGSCCTSLRKIFFFSPCSPEGTGSYLLYSPLSSLSVFIVVISQYLHPI